MKIGSGLILVALTTTLLTGCNFTDEAETVPSVDFESTYPSFFNAFSGGIDFSNMPDYANQAVPSYINKDNTVSNPITNSGALLGRILFYDKNLSSTKTVSCSSCHSQSNAFGDTRIASLGVNGFTGRHSMRLVNARFADEDNFFWDERANTLEDQVTQPIRDHNEMGFSGSNGDPSFADLIIRLESIDYYSDLFTYAFGSSEITEARMQLALAQFVRSIQSFDAPYDQGRTLVRRDTDDFPTFTVSQNAGKRLFFNLRCAACHRPPEFDITRNSRNNGVLGIIGSFSQDLTVTRSPTLRDLVKPDGSSNGAFMHDGSLTTLEAVIDHYDQGVINNSNLDNRLQAGGGARRLNLTTTEKAQLVDFLKTLSGNTVYTDTRWSDPF